jgi:glucose/mannose-6-phosphate isomerase
MRPKAKSNLLDKPIIYKNLDPSNMIQRIVRFPMQCQSAWDQGCKFPVSDISRELKQIIFLGMGGSAICGDLASDLMRELGSVPVFVNRGYTLPRNIDGHSLVFASSYSGNTEEVLSALGDAMRLGCQVIGMTSGGVLREYCQNFEIPFYQLPEDLEPRLSLGYSMVFPLAILSRLGLLQDQSSALEESIPLMSKMNDVYSIDQPADINLAKTLAMDMYRKIVVIFGSGILSAVSRRWKTQINENAKALAFIEVLPEAQHNAVESLSLLSKKHMSGCVLLLQPRTLHERVNLRYRLLEELAEEEGLTQYTVVASGKSLLSQMLTTIYFGDLVSYYLALLNKENPSPVPVLTATKERLDSISKAHLPIGY